MQFPAHSVAEVKFRYDFYRTCTACTKKDVDSWSRRYITAVIYIFLKNTGSTKATKVFGFLSSVGFLIFVYIFWPTGKSQYMYMRRPNSQYTITKYKSCICSYPYVKKSFKKQHSRIPDPSSNFGFNWTSFHSPTKEIKKCRHTGLKRRVRKPETGDFVFWPKIRLCHFVFSLPL